MACFGCIGADTGTAREQAIEFAAPIEPLLAGCDQGAFERVEQVLRGSILHAAASLAANKVHRTTVLCIDQLP